MELPYLLALAALLRGHQSSGMLSLFLTSQVSKS